ncbi:MAG: hypothetical protein M1816_005790 [Peltula sp. TS41687]|nr:MAG: hypothetical protein M1816_005790 [Peltula sp. TS41687]
MRLLSFYLAFAMTVIAGMAVPVDFSNVEREGLDGLYDNAADDWTLHAPRTEPAQEPERKVNEKPNQNNRGAGLFGGFLRRLRESRGFSALSRIAGITDKSFHQSTEPVGGVSAPMMMMEPGVGAFKPVAGIP